MRTNNQESDNFSNGHSESAAKITEREKFKKLMALDDRLEKKLNSIIEKSQRSN